MATIDCGQFFLDHNASKNFQQKAKYFIALSDADDEDDIMICFVINTDKFNLPAHCNKNKNKYVLDPKIHCFSFLKHKSSIMLSEPCFYKAGELINTNSITILNDVADENLQREISNCIDKNNITQRFLKYLKYS